MQQEQGQQEEQEQAPATPLSSARQPVASRTATAFSPSTPQPQLQQHRLPQPHPPLSFQPQQQQQQQQQPPKTPFTSSSSSVSFTTPSSSFHPTTTQRHLHPPPPQRKDEEGKEVLIQNEWITGATSSVGTCLSMCPPDEVVMREANRNKLEDRPSLPPSLSMIKDLERNPPADYPMSKIRPVEWLLKSVEYMEDELMDKGREGREGGREGGRLLDSDRSWGQVTLLENYKFHFQRLRMVAKELIMQVGREGGEGRDTLLVLWYTIFHPLPLPPSFPSLPPL